MFFDSLNIEFLYEYEGFSLRHIEDDPSYLHHDDSFWPRGELANQEEFFYLPDFYLPGHGYWIEIKGVYPAAEETYKLAMLVSLKNETGFIFYGDIPFYDNRNYMDVKNDGAHLVNKTGWDNYYWWCECSQCGRVDIQFEGRESRIPCPCDNAQSFRFSQRLKDAYSEARGKRF